MLCETMPKKERTRAEILLLVRTKYKTLSQHLKLLKDVSLLIYTWGYVEE